MQQGAVGQVRAVHRDGRALVEKRMTDRLRHDAEVIALRALAGTGLPVPELVGERAGAIVMTRMPGERLDRLDAGARLEGMRASMSLLRALHELEPPAGLPSAPDDASIVRRYRDAGGPPLPLAIPPTERLAFCHGDWSDANLLAEGGRITGMVDWEAAHVGDPRRELSRAAWAAARKDPRAFDVLVAAYGADPEAARRWVPIHAAELWLWFAEAGPPAYLEQLTTELRGWPDT